VSDTPKLTTEQKQQILKTQKEREKKMIDKKQLLIQKKEIELKQKENRQRKIAKSVYYV
jgi:hypothetical protein